MPENPSEKPIKFSSLSESDSPDAKDLDQEMLFAELLKKLPEFRRKGQRLWDEIHEECWLPVIYEDDKFYERFTEEERVAMMKKVKTAYIRALLEGFYQPKAK